MKLKPYQEEGVKFLARNPKCMLADEMGLGKTIQAIVACHVVEAERILVICPASVKGMWAKKIEEVLGKKANIISGYKGKAQGDVNIMNYDLFAVDKFRKNLRDYGNFDVVICDEAHALKSGKSIRTRAVLGAKWGLIHRTKRMWLLTGTPILNRPLDLYVIMRSLGGESLLGQYNAYFPFVFRYCAAYRERGQYLNTSGASNLEELRERLEPIFLRRTKDMVENQLPEIECIDYDFTMPSMRNVLKDEEHIASARKQLGINKVIDCKNTIQDIIDGAGKILIFIHHQEVKKMLQQMYPEALAITGLTPSHRRPIIVEQFRYDDDVKILIGQIKACGEGVDGLQYACNHVMFLEKSWTPAEMDQAVARLHRMGQEHPVTVHSINSDSDLDTRMEFLLRNKIKTINKVVN